MKLIPRNLHCAYVRSPTKMLSKHANFREICLRVFEQKWFFKMLNYSNGLYILSLGFIAFFQSLENKNDKLVKKEVQTMEQKWMVFVF